VSIAKWSGTFDSFEIVNDGEWAVYAYGGVVARFDHEGRLQT